VNIHYLQRPRLSAVEVMAFAFRSDTARHRNFQYTLVFGKEPNCRELSRRAGPATLAATEDNLQMQGAVVNAR